MSLTSPASSLIHDPAYPALKHFIIDTTGLAYYADKDTDLALRVGSRLEQLGVRDCGSYLALLQDDARGDAERHRLIGLLTIGETYFFRHIEQLDAIREIAIADAIERNRASRSLRIWSAGCATGAEPYTIAILLKRHFAAALDGWDVRIIGTDLNQTFLARAERGEFDERAFRTMSDDMRREWFTRSGSTWTVAPSLKQWVSFQYHNLVEHPYPSIVHGIAALDVILCRNVLIYFDWPVIGGILQRFHDCLVDGGWLAVGHAESNPEAFTAFHTVNAPGATIYQKLAGGRPRASMPSWPQQTFAAPAQPAPPVFPTEWIPPALPDVPASNTFGSAPAPSRPLHGSSPTDASVASIKRLADEGRWPEAARACAALAAADRLNPQAHFLDGLVREQMGGYAEAEQAFRRALYLDRGFALAHYHLGLLLKSRGNTVAAAQSFRNARELSARLSPAALIPDADGLSAGELCQLVDLQLGALSR